MDAGGDYFMVTITGFINFILIEFTQKGRILTFGTQRLLRAGHHADERVSKCVRGSKLNQQKRN